METTRHFVATVYVVCDGATLLHEHDRLGMWLPPGGHVARDELPHVTARRECYEETGLDVDLIASRGDLESDVARALPRPQHLLLEDVDVHEDGRVAHQHIDFVFYGRADGRTVDPVGRDEAGADAWRWFTGADLAALAEELPADVVEVGTRAIETVSA